MVAKPHELQSTHEDVLSVANAVRSLHSTMHHICTKGGCYRFYELMALIFPCAECFYSELEGHVGVKINGRLYDINGQIFLRIETYSKIDDAVALRAFRWREAKIEVAR